MALDEMSAETGVGAQCAFEVDDTAGCEGAEICALQRFGEQIENERIGSHRADGQAAAVHRNAFTEIDRRLERRRQREDQLRAGRRALEREHFADSFN